VAEVEGIQRYSGKTVQITNECSEQKGLRCWLVD